MIWERIISALIGIPILILFVYIGGIPLVIFVVLVALVGLFELQRIYRRMQFNVPQTLIYGSAFLFPLLAYFTPDSRECSYLFTGLILFFIVHMMLLVFAFPRLGIDDLALSYLGSCYISVLLSHLILIRKFTPYGWQLLLLVFLLTWACDIGAYFIGRLFGHRALYPTLSPHKTLEGSIGGILFCLGTAALFQFFCPILTYPKALFFGIIIGVVVQIGDLAESALKRMGKIKDSGNLIPGHGGILDRFDSLLFSAPIAYFFMKMILP
ncbi:MAG: phosphatidate cytidylyltransferase [Syntrophaceticus sp.]